MRPLWRRFGGPLTLVLVYLVVRGCFAWLSREDGLFTPEQTPNLVVVGLGLGTIALRLMVLFGLPVVVVARAVEMWLASRDTRCDSPESRLESDLTSSPGPP